LQKIVNNVVEYLKKILSQGSEPLGKFWTSLSGERPRGWSFLTQSWPRTRPDRRGSWEWPPGSTVALPAALEIQNKFQTAQKATPGEKITSVE
jgi:hypothetical protein